jgi:hypothetical protein
MTGCQKRPNTSGCEAEIRPILASADVAALLHLAAEVLGQRFLLFGKVGADCHHFCCFLLLDLVFYGCG